MQWLWYASFAAGSGMVWSVLLLPFARTRRDPIRALVERFRQRAGRREEGLLLPVLSVKERAFIEKARLAGVRWTYRQYRQFRYGSVCAGVYLILMLSLSRFGVVGAVAMAEIFRLFVLAALAGFILWFVPEWILMFSAARRRSRCLLEISKFAHRLSICVTDHTDIREMILRAGRPLRLLRPHIQQLAAQWGKDQREAIMAFKDGVGISEVYPLVNAFMAISAAKPSDVSRLLIEHSKSIDSTLEAELNKRIENAPVWISFYIMIPFLVCLFLFVYPWVLTVLEQLTVSFTGG
ncbi:hypothetical protein [Paenibacillus alkalitolerans]|uniref:hypothetical protein n=1 Tax=Paenibacillus alkalitolerans TaxID=2799335 RepID=UPI0018F43F29|nr:hypothetical protein [Paenibacillus alkalitolerans]